MDLKQLEYFVLVADIGSFSRAAVALNLAQPTLSRQVSLLESEMGQRLLVRTGRGVFPTAAGDALLVHARNLLEMAQHAREELRDLHESPSGRIAVGIPPSVGLRMTASLVERFRERFPRAVISVSEGLSLHLREQLLAGRLDMAVLFDPPPSSQLILKTLAQEPLLLVGHADASKLAEPVPLSDLPDYPLVLSSRPNAIRVLMDRTLESRGVELQIIAEVGAIQTALALVARKVGYTIIPRSALALAPPDAKLCVAQIGPPTIRNSLVFAVPLARPSGRLSRGTEALICELNWSEIHKISTA